MGGDGSHRKAAKEQVTAKERVRAALEGRIPDRVPYGEFAVDFDTVGKIIGHETYLRAKAKSQIAFWEGRHEEVAESWRKDHIELHRRLELDIVTFPMATWEMPAETDDPPPRRVDPTTWEDKSGRVFKLSEITHDITCVRDPVRDAKIFTAAEFLKEPDPPRRDERSWKVLDAVIREFKAEKFICGPSGGCGEHAHQTRRDRCGGVHGWASPEPAANRPSAAQVQRCQAAPSVPGRASSSIC